MEATAMSTPAAVLVWGKHKRFVLCRPCSCRIPWPKDNTDHYPEELHNLVKLCLQVTD